MKKKIKKLYLQQKKRALKKIVGTPERPRLVFRSHKHIYAQLIDDFTGTTITASSTLDKQLKEKIEKAATCGASQLVGEQVAERAIGKDITKVVFDRGNRPYHGRIASVAEGARSKGLIL